MARVSLRRPDGKFWSFKEIVQGKPLGHPSHAMFIHFPVAFYIGCLALDVMSKLGRFPSAPLAGTWLIIGAFLGSLFAVTTGLVDWAGMIKGSKKRRWATKHMLLQLVTFAIFAVNLAVRWPDRHLPEAKPLWLILDLIGVAILSVGQWFGGVLVYEMAMRVSTGTDEQAVAPGASSSR